MNFLWHVLYGFLLMDVCDWYRILTIHCLSFDLVLWKSYFCALCWDVYSQANAGALLDLRSQPFRRVHGSVMINLSMDLVVVVLLIIFMDIVFLGVPGYGTFNLFYGHLVH